MSLTLILIAVAIGIFLLERKWGPYALSSIRILNSCDHLLAEPDQPVT